MTDKLVWSWVISPDYAEDGHRLFRDEYDSKSDALADIAHKDIQALITNLLKEYNERLSEIKANAD